MEDTQGDRPVSSVTKDDVATISKFCTKELLEYLGHMQGLGSEKEKSEFLADLIGQPQAEAAKLLKKQAKKPVKREALLQLLENAKTLMDESNLEERQPAAPGSDRTYSAAERQFYLSMVTLEAEILEQAAKVPPAQSNNAKQKQFVPAGKGKRASTTKKKTQQASSENVETYL